MRAFVKRHWLATLLGSLHFALAATALVIDFFDAWNDENATLLVAMLLFWIDYPLWQLWYRAHWQATLLADVIVIGAVGTIVWSFVGFVLQTAWRNCARRYSLRALLIATTLVAIVLAIIAALTRS